VRAFVSVLSPSELVRRNHRNPTQLKPLSAVIQALFRVRITHSKVKTQDDRRAHKETTRKARHWKKAPTNPSWERRSRQSSFGLGGDKRSIVEPHTILYFHGIGSRFSVFGSRTMGSCGIGWHRNGSEAT